MCRLPSISSTERKMIISLISTRAVITCLTILFIKIQYQPQLMRGISGWGFCLENELHAAAAAATVCKCIEFLRMHAINVIYVESELQKERNKKTVAEKQSKTTAAVTVNRLRAGKIKLQFVFGLDCVLQECSFASKWNYVSTWPNNANRKTAMLLFFVAWRFSFEVARIRLDEQFTLHCKKNACNKTLFTWHKILQKYLLLFFSLLGSFYA